MKTISIQSIFLFTLFTNITYGQPILDWIKIIGGGDNDEAISIHSTVDKGCIILGTTQSTDNEFKTNKGNADWVVSKLNEKGNVEWLKLYGGSGADAGRSILQTKDGGYILAGNTSSNDGDISKNNGWTDFWVVRTNHEGNIIWEKSFGGSRGESLIKIIQTSNGGYVLGGMTDSNDKDVSKNRGLTDIWIIKLDESGNLLWEKSFGGSQSDFLRDIIQTNDLGFALVGVSTSSDGDFSFNRGAGDAYFLKIDSIGNLLYKKKYGGTKNDFFNSITECSNGNFNITGSSESIDGDLLSNKGLNDIWLGCFDKFGNIIWTRSFGGSGDDSGTDHVVLSDSSILITSSTSSNNYDVTFNNGFYDIWILKIDKDGNLVWQKSFGGTDYEFSFTIDKFDKNIYIGGRTKSIDGDIVINFGKNDIIVLKLTDNVSNTNYTKGKQYSITIYPNPSSKNINIELANLSLDILNSINILDENGIFLKSIDSNDIKENITISLPNGTYIVNFIDNKNNIIESKIVLLTN